MSNYDLQLRQLPTIIKYCSVDAVEVDKLHHVLERTKLAISLSHLVLMLFHVAFT